MKIVVTIPFKEEQKMRIREKVGGNEIIFASKDTLTQETLEEAEILMGNLPIEMIKKAKNLKWLQLNSAGANQYCGEEILKESVLLSNAAGAYSTSVSENMLTYTLCLMKKLYLYHDNQKNHLWRDEGQVMSAKEAVILVIGMGDIGTSYARKMKTLGSYVIGVRRKNRIKPEGFDEVYLIDELNQVLPRADITVIALPDTVETVGLFTEERLRKMKEKSYLINVGRGSIIDTESLIKVMKERYLSGAVLDVTNPEPLPKEHELWDTPNVWITPHIAGGFHIDETLERICNICCENLSRYLNGKELTHLVDRRYGY